MNYNRAIVASAGSGKTTQIIEEVIAKESSILIVTYTTQNTLLLKRGIEKRVGYIPSNITIMTWHSFLLKHCIRPFRSSLSENEIKNIDFKTMITNYKIPEKNTKMFYFSSKSTLYAKRATKFAISCNNASDGSVIKRLEKIFKEIYIDEVQDMAGEDVDLLRLLLESKIQVTMVGDPRQAIYFTTISSKNKRVKGSNFVEKLKEWENANLLKIEYKNYSHRCCQDICDLSDALFPEIEPKTNSKNHTPTNHTGLYVLRDSDFEDYIREVRPIVLRWSKSAKLPECSLNYPKINIGISKGSTFEHVVILCTEAFKKFIQDGIIPNQDKARCELYVAITRAKFSVAFVADIKTPFFSNIKCYNTKGNEYDKMGISEISD